MSGFGARRLRQTTTSNRNGLRVMMEIMKRIERVNRRR
jgi:hypothetical protein